MREYYCLLVAIVGLLVAYGLIGSLISALVEPIEPVGVVPASTGSSSPAARLRCQHY